MSTQPADAGDFKAETSQGAADYFQHTGRYQNPYQSMDPRFNAYERGWMQSLKKDGGRLVSLRGLGEPTVNAKKPGPTNNAYAELKGRIGPRK